MTRSIDATGSVQPASVKGILVFMTRSGFGILRRFVRDLILRCGLDQRSVYSRERRGETEQVELDSFCTNHKYKVRLLLLRITTKIRIKTFGSTHD